MVDMQQQDITISRFLLDVIPIAASSISESDMISNFTKAVSSSFGIESVKLGDLKSVPDSNALYGYINNTKKTYIDNQLSEYSAFPELINFKNNGFRSCAVMPLIADGKVVSVLEMLSKTESKFGDDLIKNITLGASFIGFVLMYKGEVGRSIKLATYFDAAFNSQNPQLIISESGSIIKSNKAAVKQFEMAVPEKRDSTELLGLSFQRLVDLSRGASMTLVPKGGGARVFQVVVNKINDRLVHLAANDITDAFIYTTINGMIQRNNSICVVITDSDFRISNVSSNAEYVFGYPKSVLANGSFTDMLSKAERNPLDDSFSKSLAKESDIASGSLTFELSNIGKSYMHYTAKRFFDGYLFLLMRADAEKYIENMRNDLKAFMESSSDIVLGIDNLGYIRDCNLPAETVLGFKKEDMLGKDIKSLYKDQGALDKDINYARNVGRVDNIMVDIIGKNDEIIPAIHFIRPLHSVSQENEVEYLIILKELKSKRALEEQRNDNRDLSRQLDSMKKEGNLKSQFIYNISHELKSPLTSIKGYSKLLYDGEFGPLNDEQKEYIKTTLDEADRLMLIIQQVLDAAKLEAEKIKLDLRDVDLKTLGNNASIKALEESARNKGLYFKWEVAWNAPEKIIADPNRLIQVFVNLIGNAIKFTSAGGITVKIEPRTKGTILCSVIDTGIGMKDEDRNKLKRRGKFYEIKKDSANNLVQQPGAGTGLGLAITKDLVKLHGGKLDITSAPGKGSTFFFVLPINPRKRRDRSPESQGNSWQTPQNH